MTDTASRSRAAEIARRVNEELVKYRGLLAAELSYPTDLQNVEAVAYYRGAISRLETKVFS